MVIRRKAGVPDARRTAVSDQVSGLVGRSWRARTPRTRDPTDRRTPRTRDLRTRRSPRSRRRTCGGRRCSSFGRGFALIIGVATQVLIVRALTQGGLRRVRLRTGARRRRTDPAQPGPGQAAQPLHGHLRGAARLPPHVRGDVPRRRHDPGHQHADHRGALPVQPVPGRVRPRGPGRRPAGADPGLPRPAGGARPGLRLALRRLQQAAGDLLPQVPHGPGAAARRRGRTGPHRRQRHLPRRRLRPRRARRAVCSTSDSSSAPCASGGCSRSSGCARSSSPTGPSSRSRSR